MTLLEYSMSAVTEGIDAIAATRVLIRGEDSRMATHALTGEQVNRTFRYYDSFLDFEQIYCIQIWLVKTCCLHGFRGD